MLYEVHGGIEEHCDVVFLIFIISVFKVKTIQFEI